MCFPMLGCHFKVRNFAVSQDKRMFTFPEQWVSSRAERTLVVKYALLEDIQAETQVLCEAVYIAKACIWKEE